MGKVIKNLKELRNGDFVFSSDFDVTDKNKGPYRININEKGVFVCNNYHQSNQSEATELFGYKFAYRISNKKDSTSTYNIILEPRDWDD